MGNISSNIEEGAPLYLRDQQKLSIQGLKIRNSRNQVLVSIEPNGFPATKLLANKDRPENGMIEYIQDPDQAGNSTNPSFLFRLSNNDELFFTFTFAIRQYPSTSANSKVEGVERESVQDTIINGLTFILASNTRELDNLITREFHADPNLHLNSNVELVGDISTAGHPLIQTEWTWKWHPPKAAEDTGGGWRNSCCFVEYDQRGHKFNTLATFSFWVQSSPKAIGVPESPSLNVGSLQSARLRVPSAQSVESRISDTEFRQEIQPPSPNEASADTALGLIPSVAGNTVVSCQRPGEDVSAVEDGPLFRATMKALEQKTGNMRMKMKKILKKAEAAQQAQAECNLAMSGFLEALREASRSEASAIKPAMEHYFDTIANDILKYERRNTTDLQKLVIDPLSRLYNIDLKQAESKKKDFEEESRDYYAYVGRYLGQRQDSLKEKKRVESDSKYQTKRRNFELKRFDYSSFMQDLHGGRKEQEMLSYLTKYADSQTKEFLSTAKKVEGLLPQLEALNMEVKETDKEYRFQRTEREEKRRTLEKNTKNFVEPDTTSPLAVPNPQTGSNGYFGDRELKRGDSTASTLRGSSNSMLGTSPTPNSLSASKPNIASPGASQSLPQGSSPADKFKGIRDMEQKDYGSGDGRTNGSGEQRKEGLLWALSRPGSHADPKGLNKQAWHKFWIVLDQGKLSEYGNWKQKLDLHMEPIDLRMASVREARSAERRFCFEVITPHFKRVYQATSEDDMNNWIIAINNALQSAVEGRDGGHSFQKPESPEDGRPRRDIGSVLTGKSSSLHGHARESSSVSSVYRRTTVGSRPIYVRSTSNGFEDNPDRLLKIVRDADQGNNWCADCGSGSKTEWVSINLGIVLCIECSGIHRSLGTHISKVRSLTLDITSFTTDIVELLLQIGNRVSNMVWEATYAETPSEGTLLTIPTKPGPQSTREARLQFITAKYVKRMFVRPLSPTMSRFSTPEDTLLASIKRNDLQNILYALALKANPNSTDRSRNTHAVFLALAAADPAQPGGAEGSSTTMSNTKSKHVSFPAAELLVQNGAEIPTGLPAFQLSKNGLQYIEQKSGKSVGNSSPGGDAVGALPIIGEGSANSPSPSLSVGTREKLQKRVSAGGRIGRV